MTGEVTDEEFAERFTDFYRGGEWAPTMKEFVDLSAADLRRVTADGLARLAETLAVLFEEDGVTDYKTAVYSPADLPFGLARLYEAYTATSPESVQVFRDHDAALRWLLD